MEKREILITRIFNAPRETVWKAWTEPEKVMNWWGPKGFTAPVIQIDLKPGGRYLYCMRDPQGKDYWSTGTFKEIVKPEKIVATDSFADENGNVVPATHYDMSADMPMEMVVTATFEDLGNKTKLTLRHDSMPDEKMLDMATQGWNQSLDKLEAIL